MEIQNNKLSRLGKEFIDIRNEKLESFYIKQIIKKIEEFFQSVGYSLISKNFSLAKKFFKDIDIIALKSIKIKEDLEEIIILPIKMSNLKGTLIISDKEIDYRPYQNKLNLNDKIKKILIGSNVNCLLQVQEELFEDLKKKNNLLHIFKQYLKINLNFGKTILNKRLFFRSGPILYKVLIEPTLICQNEVGFLEKNILFPYLKNSNVHIIKFDDLLELIKFLEKKYVMIETYSDQENTVKSYFKVKEKIIGDLRLYSFPYLVFGFVFLVMLFFQSFSIIKVFINIGYAAIGIYLILVFYLYLRFQKRKSEILKEFNTPYYERDVKIDETDLIMMNEEMPNDLMDQFIYECFGKGKDFSIISKIEKEKANKLIPNDLISKYSSFMVD